MNDCKLLSPSLSDNFLCFRAGVSVQQPRPTVSAYLPYHVSKEQSKNIFRTRLVGTVRHTKRSPHDAGCLRIVSAPVGIELYGAPYSLQTFTPP